jgi:hypothetical protein
MIAKIKVIFNDVLRNIRNIFLVLRLINRLIEKLVLERYEFDFFNLINAVILKKGSTLNLCY